MKEKLMDAYKFVARNWYASLLTVVGCLIAFEILWPGAGFVVPFLCFLGWGMAKIIGK